jgi:hypothetical protein
VVYIMTATTYSFLHLFSIANAIINLFFRCFFVLRIYFAMNGAYDINEAITGGGALDDLLQRLQADPLSALLLGLLIIAVVYLLWKQWEHFNPTQTMNLQQSDQISVGAGGYSGLYKQVLQSKAVPVDTSSVAGIAPGSLAYQVLNSGEFSCATRQQTPDDAWTWMNSHYNDAGVENMENRPKNDNEFSKILAGK